MHHGSCGQEKSGKNHRIRESLRILHSKLQSQEKLRGSGRVREFESTRVQKLTKMQKNILNCCMQTACTTVKKIFMLTLLADYLYLHFQIHFTAFLCDCKRLKTDTGVSHEQISQGKWFILSWKVRENEFCRVVEAMVHLSSLVSWNCFCVVSVGFHRVCWVCSCCVSHISWQHWGKTQL